LQISDAAIQPYMIDTIELMEQKERQILFRVTEEERKLIQQTADSEGRTVSAWVRWTIKNRLQELGIVPKKTATKKKKA
jgi:hypothetical protein